jgi:3',5'-cyclic AMP phosphodiesterase CpdA
MSAKPFLLLQISDTHLGADWKGVEPDECLLRAVEAILELPQRPDALVITGDLTQNGAPEEYERVRQLIAPLDLEPHVLPGNHDLRGAIREAFGLPGDGEEHVSYAVDLGPLRLVCLDSIVPGIDGGSLDGGRTEWLDAALAEEPERPTVLAMHHPPLSTALPTFDAIGLAPEWRAELGEVLARHPQVLRVIAGHVHRPIVAELAGRAVLSVPSTYLQAVLKFDPTAIEMRPDPPGFAIHALRDGVLTSHVQSF